MDNYHSFTEKGYKVLPDKQELLALLNDNIEPILFLDSCVCLDIVKVIDYKRKAINANIQKVINLKRYISSNNLKVRPMFGLIELSYENGHFNTKKYWDFRNRIRFFEEIPLKHFMSFKYDFNKDFFILNTPDLNLESTFKSLEYFFLNTYCCLLKIRAISLNGLSKAKAENNITEFFNWMSNDLGIILGIEYRLALSVFGGSNEYRKMIWLDGDNSLVKRKIIGTSWDICHTRLCTNNFEFGKILENRNIEGYFITNDNLLFNLHAHYSLSGIIEKSEDFGTMKIFNTDFNIPHFTEDFIDKQNGKMIDEMAERFNKPSKNNVEQTRILIENLEKINNVA
jgi:hypothetical protein